MIKRIATAAVYVENQEQAVRFWTEKTGFEIRANHPMGEGGSWIEVAPPGAESCLVLYPRAMMPNWKEMNPALVFLCDDVHKTYEEMKGKGVRFFAEPKKMPWGTYAHFGDEDGNEFIMKS